MVAVDILLWCRGEENVRVTLQKQNKQLTEKTIKHIHKSYKEAINEFDDIRDIDLRKYLDDVE